MEKTYDFEVEVKFSQREHAKNKKEAIKKLKESFKRDYNIEIDDDEITLID